jgi:hypothetical protein
VSAPAGSCRQARSLALALIALAPAAARAQDDAATVGPGAPPPGKLEWKGRVFARAAYEDTVLSSAGMEARGERLRLTVPSARVGLKYQPLPALSLVAEADLTDRQVVRDAYVQARSKRLRARAGRFKMPLSAITLESPWTLPVARRGTLQDLLEERMSLVGRRPGFLLAVDGGGGLDPELSLSAFQGAFLTGDPGDTDLELLESGVDAQNLVARFAVTPDGQELAIHGERTSTSGFQGRRQHFWGAGADATLDGPFGADGLRAWLEVLVGQTFYIDELSSRDATFASARAIVAWRWGGREDRARYLEPYLMAGYLDPDLDGSRDCVNEIALGLNLGLWRTFRLTLQLEAARSQERLPGQLFFGNVNLRSQKAALLQVGMAF